MLKVDITVVERITQLYILNFCSLINVYKRLYIYLKNLSLKPLFDTKTFEREVLLQAEVMTIMYLDVICCPVIRHLC